MSSGKHQKMKGRKRPVHSWQPASPSLLTHSPASSRPVDMTSPATALPNLNNSCWFLSQAQIKCPTFPVLSHKRCFPEDGHCHVSYCITVLPSQKSSQRYGTKMHVTQGEGQLPVLISFRKLQRRFPKPPQVVSAEADMIPVIPFCLLSSSR